MVSGYFEHKMNFIGATVFEIWFSGIYINEENKNFGNNLKNKEFRPYVSK